MKEQYTAPELKLLCFVPAERLAASFSLDDLLTLKGSAEPGASVGDGDIEIDF